MSISRLTASLASVSNELTVAAAALNFDFSLIKIDPPEEFKLVGGTLSANRRLNAEGGRAHITARKLGALFRGIIPPIPNLSKAYGCRASEISSNPAANPQASSRDGVFAAQVGADATALWAAATSGSAAIAVNLLACLLARVWTGPEATSLWTEIVERRRQEIAGAYERNEEIDLPTLSIARQEFNRAQLAEWDASARGWLRAADVAKESELKQLMLIIKNIDVCVDRASDPYEGIIRVWKNALNALECLVKGTPQSVSDGSVLMAIWAWHLYPDLVIVRGANADVRFKDPLILCGGCLTIGLQMENEEKMQDGVHWSLSLANLRYYGDPVVLHRAVVPDASRLSFSELAQVVLGSLLSQWTVREDDIFAAAELFLALWNAISHAATSGTEQGTSEKERKWAQRFLTFDSNWMHILVDAARQLVEPEGVEQQTATQLVKLGQRRGAEFFCAELPPFFGLLSFHNLLALFKSAEARIRLIRNVALRILPREPDDFIPAIIRYTHGPERSFEYASVFPDSCISTKREFSKGKPEVASKLKRWISSKEFESLAGSPRNKIETHVVMDWSSRRMHIESLKEDILAREEAGVRSLGESRLQSATHKEDFVYAIGDRVVAALFVPESYQACLKFNFSKLPEEVIDICQATNILRSNSLRIDKFILMLAGKAGDDPVLGGPYPGASSLRAFSSAARVYKLLYNATISPKILSRRFHEGLWIPKRERKVKSTSPSEAFQGELLSRAQSFACIALLESGTHNIEPSLLRNVMAISSSDSIYVTAPLLCDPWETPLTDEIRRIAGNIGRAGLAMLFAPENVRFRRRDDTHWRVVNHADFDGTPGDNFSGISLHLSFTGYERPLDTDADGAKDVDVYLLETRLSIHDEGKWLGDLNILQSLQSSSMSKLVYPIRCTHTAFKALTWRMTAVDNWDELLDEPKNACIVRARRNWIARLAFICICHQLGRRTIVLPDDVCWECSADLFVCECLMLLISR